ncbi:aminoglycoside phosphotransferase family protein [Clostridium subterminale]|uniref:Aminoglycoside phosphotransferase family protein n=1 Tax=Clostridium subterminale TaxID=1550 RepID=A0ABP3W463_CLOSU
MHRIYAIKTTKGKYAIKALNPQIILRAEAMQNFINSEEIANIASKSISALPAKRFNEIFIHKVDNQFYLVFDWVDGKSLKPNEIDIEHCEKIGSILADIHMTDFSELIIVNDWSDNEHITDWDYYLQRGKENDSMWVNLMIEVVDRLYEWSTQTEISLRLLATDMVISHRDLDSKNVMWSKGKPIIIDWEAAGYVNPMAELIETAIYWSENEIGNINKEKFLAFINGYKNIYGTLNANWKIVLSNGFLGKLEWLEYNLKRSSGIECSDEEE